MITVETIPVRMTAEQWLKPGDCEALGVAPYRVGSETRYGLHSLLGHYHLRPGDWLVVSGKGVVKLYAPEEFHQRFRIVEADDA